MLHLPNRREKSFLTFQKITKWGNSRTWRGGAEKPAQMRSWGEDQELCSQQEKLSKLLGGRGKKLAGAVKTLSEHFLRGPTHLTIHTRITGKRKGGEGQNLTEIHYHEFYDAAYDPIRRMARGTCMRKPNAIPGIPSLHALRKGEKLR